MSAADLLLDARDLISDPDRWCQNKAHDSEGRMCAIGALTTAATYAGASDYIVAARYLRKAARQVFGHLTAPSLNDHPNTVHADIVLLFEEAAKLAKEES